MLPKNFKSKLIDKEFEKLPGNTFSTRRRQALTKNERDVKDPHRIIAPIPLPKIREVLKKHHRSKLKNAPDLREIFRAPPMASFREPPNLRRLISKSKLHEFS